VIEVGRVAFRETPRELREQPLLTNAYLGATTRG